MKFKILKGLFAIGLTLWVSMAIATPLPDPIAELQGLSDKMILALKHNKASMKKNPQVVYDIVNDILVPYCDVPLMARLALGRNAWNSASSADQIAFTEAFKVLMMQTYASGLSSYTDESVKFFPIRGGIQEGQNRLEVKSEILRNDGPNISVNYRLIYQGNRWDVYDFCVEGICMIDSFRSQFAATNKSVAALTAQLNAHNQPKAA